MKLIASPPKLTLLELIHSLPDHQWNYYRDVYPPSRFRKPFISRVSAVNFIRTYFNRGEKELITQQFNIDSFLDQRAEHTVTIYFLGLILYHNTQFNKQTFFAAIKASDSADLMMFIWFITCQSHDLAFYQEIDKNLLLQAPTLDALRNAKQAIYDLFSLKVPKIPPLMLASCEAYFAFRHKSGKIDHGIHAGMILYDNLIKNRHSPSLKRLDHGPWLDEHYAYAAATVAVHNIWLPTSSNQHEYKKNGLGRLVKQKPITFQEAPLLYFLGLVDTIDPVKAYSCITTKTVLKNVYIKIKTPYSFEISVSEELRPEILVEKAKAAKAWLDILYSKTARGVIITIKTGKPFTIAGKKKKIP